jgi:hypothetical protein
MAIVRLETTSKPTAPQPSAPVVVAASSTPGASKPDDSVKYVAVGLFVAGILMGAVIAEVRDPMPFVPAEGVGMFAVFYVAAQALERLFELLRWLFPKATSLSNTSKADAREETKQSTAAALEALANDPRLGGTDKTVKAAADAKATEEKIESQTSLVAWGVNSFLAAVLAGWLGLYLLNAIGVQDVNTWVDIAVTSLVIGGGTKPLHDLIKNLEKGKEETTPGTTTTS